MTLDTLDRVLPEPEDPDELLRAFTVTVIDVTAESLSNTHTVLDSYVEEEWLAYIGPLSLLVARKIAKMLSEAGSHKRSVTVKEWCSQLGTDDPEEFLSACRRLVRWGHATWDARELMFSLSRRWSDVSPMMRTPEHREALMRIVDPPLGQ